MAELNQDRLRKLVAMMGSDNAGERANAAAAFHAGLTGINPAELTFGSAHLGMDLVAQQLAKIQHMERRVNATEHHVRILETFVSARVKRVAADQAAAWDQQSVEVNGQPGWVKSRGRN